MRPDAGPPAPPRPGMRLGRVLGVPVYLRYSWLLLAVVVVVLYAGVLERLLPQLTAPGRYAYRLRTGTDTSAETWLTIPGSALALAGFRPNPADGARTVAFTLAVPGPGPCLGQSLALLGQPVRPPLRVVVGKVMTKDERSSGNEVVVATPQRGSILIPTSTETE